MAYGEDMGLCARFVDAAKPAAIADSQRFSEDTGAAVMKSASQIGYYPLLP